MGRRRLIVRGVVSAGAFVCGWVSGWAVSPSERPVVAPTDAVPAMCGRVVRWTPCDAGSRASDLDVDVANPDADGPDATPGAPGPRTHDLSDLEACARDGGHAVLVDCSEWPCLVLLGFRTSGDYDIAACRQHLPPDLPMKAGALISGGVTYPYRTYWLADASLIPRWDDPLWAERQTARERVLRGDLKREADLARE